MRDDARFVVHPNGSKEGYMPFIVHERLAWKDRQTIKRLIIALVIVSAALIVAIMR